MIGLVVIAIWFGASIWFLHLAHDRGNWQSLPKITVILAAICSILTASGIFDPTQSRFIGAAEINDTSNLAIVIGIVEAICILGPLAAIYYIRWKIQLDREWKDIFPKDKEKD